MSEKEFETPVSIRPVGKRKVVKRKPPVKVEKVSYLPEIRIEVSKLPSRGVPYPEGSSVSYKTYSFGEVQKASTSNMNIVSAIELTMSGIEVQGFDKNSLTLFDCLYLGVMRKISSLGGMKFEMPYVCRGCGKATSSVFSENELSFRDLSKDIISLPIEADIQGKTIKFAPMNVKEFLDLHKGRYSKYLTNGKIDKTAIYATLIKNMDFKDTMDMLRNLRDPDDIDVLSEIDKVLLHDLNFLKTTCSETENSEECGTENLLKLEGREALLRPFRKGEGSVRARIRFGNKQPS